MERSVSGKNGWSIEDRRSTIRKPRSLVPVLAAAGLALAGAGRAFAAAELIVSFPGIEPGSEAAVELEAPDGSRRSAADEDGDGVILLSCEDAGSYQITLHLGDEEPATRRFEVPESGQVNLVFQPRARGEKVRITYGGAEEKILVTARRREEDLQETPISIAVYPSEALEDRSMRDLSDLSDFTPNMDFTNMSIQGGSSSDAIVYIRGIGQISTALFSDPGVGLYVDGVYLARAQGAVLDLLDLERAEILRGPQGTLFGKNTIGGAIHLITRKPDSTFDADLQLAAGSFDRVDAKLRVDGPLAEKVYGSLALASTSSDGIGRSLATGEEYYDDNRDSGRLALRFAPRDGVTLDWTADYTREREHAVDWTLLFLDHSVPILDFYNRVTGAAGFPTYSEQFITGDPLRTFSDEENFSHGDVWGTALSAGWTLGGLELRSITSYRELDYDVSFDLDGAPIRYGFRPTTTTQEQFSGELQLLGLAAADRLAWVVGALYFTEDSHETSQGQLFGGLFEALEAAPGPVFAPPGLPDFLCDPGPPPPGLPCFGGAGNPVNLAFLIDPDRRGVDDLGTASYALFGEGTFSPGAKLSLTAGLRYTHETKDYRLRSVPGPSSFVPPLELFNEDTWEAVTPRFSLAYQAKPDVLLYASISNGFKSGGFNGLRGGGTGSLLEPFDPERVWTYELGLKSDWLSRRLRLNGALFFNDYTDLQLTAAVTLDNQPATLIENAGKSEVKGFELELRAQPGKGWLLDLGIGYIDAEYTELDPSVVGIPRDGTIPKTPEWSVVFSPQYTFRRADGGAVILRADYSYKSRFFHDVGNTEEVAQEPYDLVHARASYLLPSGRWEVALFGTNLTDESYFEHTFVTLAFGPGIGAGGRPREWGASVRYRF